MNLFTSGENVLGSAALPVIASTQMARPGSSAKHLTFYSSNNSAATEKHSTCSVYTFLLHFIFKWLCPCSPPVLYESLQLLLKFHFHVDLKLRTLFSNVTLINQLMRSHCTYHLPCKTHLISLANVLCVSFSLMFTIDTPCFLTKGCEFTCQI